MVNHENQAHLTSYLCLVSIQCCPTLHDVNSAECLNSTRLYNIRRHICRKNLALLITVPISSWLTCVHLIHLDQDLFCFIGSCSTNCLTRLLCSVPTEAASLSARQACRGSSMRVASRSCPRRISLKHQPIDGFVLNVRLLQRDYSE